MDQSLYQPLQIHTLCIAHPQQPNRHGLVQNNIHHMENIG